MSRLIDADALERDGWHMNRTVRVDKDTMEFQTRKPTDFPTIEPQKMRGKWMRTVLGSTNGYGTTVMYQCSECECMSISKYNYCPYCGAWMGGQDGTT